MAFRNTERAGSEKYVHKHDKDKQRHNNTDAGSNQNGGVMSHSFTEFPLLSIGHVVHYSIQCSALLLLLE